MKELPFYLTTFIAAQRAHIFVPVRALAHVNFF